MKLVGAKEVEAQVKKINKEVKVLKKLLLSLKVEVKVVAK